MVLHWVAILFLGISSIILLTITGVFLLYHCFKTRYRNLIYITLSIFNLINIWIFFMLGSLFESRIFIIIASNLISPGGFFLTLWIDSVTRESTYTIRHVILTASSVVIAFASFIPDIFILEFQLFGLVVELNFLMLSMALTLIMIFIQMLYYLLKIFRMSPRNLRKYASISLTGVIMYNSIIFLYPLLIQDEFSLIIFAPFFGVGALLIAPPFVLQPKLAHVLRFRAIRFTVVETRSGVAMFNYVWSQRDDVDPQLFSAMLHALTSFMNETLGKGNIREIHLDQAILLVQNSEKYPIACVLVATRATKALRQALNSFATQFFKDYSQYFDNTGQIDKFESASKLVRKHFPFVPQYD